MSQALFDCAISPCDRPPLAIRTHRHQVVAMNTPVFDLDPVNPSTVLVRNDRARLRLAFLSALALVGGLWLLWIATISLGWSNDDLALLPRTWRGLLGILTAPLAHASLAHLVSNTAPLLLLGTLTLYAYPLAVRRALPLIWIVSGLGVWLWGRPSHHLGISGIIHGLMFFLFVIGLLRRDRLAITIALAVFFFYGGMVMTVLPHEPDISWEYHLFGAFGGTIAAILWDRLDPLPARKKYSWDLEEEQRRYAEEHAHDDELEPARPHHVPVLWHRPEAMTQRQRNAGNVIHFPDPHEPRRIAVVDAETRHDEG